MRRTATLISSLLVAASLSASAEYVFRVPAPIRPGAELAPQLSFSPQSLSFDVAVGSSQTLTARLSNTGAGAANALQLNGPLAPYSAAYTCGASLAAGSSCDVAVTFTPTAAGPSGDGVQALSGTAGVTLGLDGIGRQGQFAVAPTSLAFGDVSVGANATLTATLSNTGDAALPIAFGTLAAPYSLSHTCPASLAPAAACTLTVTFAPTVTGATSASLAIGSGVTGATLAVSGVGNQPGFIAVEAGNQHVLSMRSDQSLWSMGYNGNGQLGANVPHFSASWVDTGMRDVAEIDAGTLHSIIKKIDGSVWVVGYNANGEFGDGTTGTTTVWRHVPISGVTEISAGNQFTLILKSDGTAWGSGVNTLGQLGVGDTSNKNTFTQSLVMTSARKVATGGGHSLIVTESGDLWGTGSNTSGQVGLGVSMGVNAWTSLGVANVAAIAAGNTHSVIAKSDGSVWVSGANGSGQLGVGDTTNRTSFVLVGGISGITSVAAGTLHTAALASDGTVWVAGGNASGQLGLGDTVNRNAFVHVPGLSGVIAISAGGNATIVVKDDGTSWAAGVIYSNTYTSWTRIQ